MSMKSYSLNFHVPFFSLDPVAASRESAAFSARKVSGALTRRRNSRLAILAPRGLALLPLENSEMGVPEGQIRINPMRDLEPGNDWMSYKRRKYSLCAQ